MSEFLQNAWYVAAWSEELTDKPLGRRYLDTPVVLYRGTDGRAAALLDRCPHRFAPLSRGRVDGSELVCGYHGMRMNQTGACVDSRLSVGARKAACVRSFPLVERDGILWIWMGDASQADHGQIRDYGFLEDGRNRTIRGSMSVDANYVLEIENLLDLSHLDYLHIGSIANGGLTTGTFDTEEVDDTVFTRWEAPSCPTPPQFAQYLPGINLVDQWTDFRWDAPGTLYLYNGVTLPGAPRAQGIEIHQGHFVTPISQKSCYYFWSVAQKRELVPDSFVEPMTQIVRGVFEGEDRPMIEAQQATMKGVDLWAEKPVLFPEDAGAVRARKILERKIRTENEAASSTP